MRLIYLDEAGVSNPAQEPFLVVAGVIIHGDQQWKNIENGLLSIVNNFIPEPHRPGFIFHSTELFSGGKYFNRETWPREKRWEILDALIQLIAENNLPIVSAFVDRAKFHELNITLEGFGAEWGRKNETLLAHGLAFAECAHRAQEWLDIYGGNEVGMFIAEDTDRGKRFIKKIHAEFRNPASDLFKIADVPIKPLSKIIDTIHFAEKNETSILQLADVSAFVYKRMLMGKPDSQRFAPTILAGTLWPDAKKDAVIAAIQEKIASDGLLS